MIEQNFVVIDNNDNILEFINNGQCAIYTKRENGKAKKAFLLYGIKFVGWENLNELNTQIKKETTSTYDGIISTSITYSFNHFYGD